MLDPFPGCVCGGHPGKNGIGNELTMVDEPVGASLQLLDCVGACDPLSRDEPGGGKLALYHVRALLPQIKLPFSSPRHTLTGTAPRLSLGFPAPPTSS